MNRTNLINYIIKKQGYKSYLEIGVGTGKNFRDVKCKEKASVDPDDKVNATYRMTSDDYFMRHTYGYDICFIDGLHHADQVRRDIENAWLRLDDGGCLILHDTNPDREEITHVPRDSKEWCGDVYKAIHQIDGPPKFTLKDDHGVTVIRKTGPLVMSDGVIEWDGFVMFREAILHLVTWEEAIKIIDEWSN